MSLAPSTPRSAPPLPPAGDASHCSRPRSAPGSGGWRRSMPRPAASHRPAICSRASSGASIGLVDGAGGRAGHRERHRACRNQTAIAELAAAGGGRLDDGCLAAAVDRPPRDGGPASAADYVAVFQKDDVAPAFYLTIDLKTRQLTLRPVGAQRQPGKTYQMWIASDQLGPDPRSLGLVDDDLAPTRKSLAAFDPTAAAKGHVRSQRRTGRWLADRPADQPGAARQAAAGGELNERSRRRRAAAQFVIGSSRQL